MMIVGNIVDLMIGHHKQVIVVENHSLSSSVRSVFWTGNGSIVRQANIDRTQHSRRAINIELVEGIVGIVEYDLDHIRCGIVSLFLLGCRRNRRYSPMLGG